MSVTVAKAPRFSVSVGSSPTDALEVGLPVLSGPVRETLFPGARSLGRQGRLHLSQSEGWLFGAAAIDRPDNLQSATHELYDEVFSALGDRKLARCWNYVPDINACGHAGLENYQVFCRGRSLAFENRFGPGFTELLPAASAVGTAASNLVVAFAASDLPLRHVENPLQIPAYQYPDAYGPRAPSFSRATIITGRSQTTVFISGTSSIRGHSTIAPHETHQQVECTLANLEEIASCCGLGRDLARGHSQRRVFKVYVRHANEHADVERLLERSLLKSTDEVTYLLADICRSDLNVEIEATITVA